MDINDINRLFDYTEWANHLVLDAVDALPVEQQIYDFKISHGSIHGTLAHIAGAEWIWLNRWKGTSLSAIWTAEDFKDIQSLRERWNHVEVERRGLLETLSNEKLQDEWSYRNMKGESYSLPLIEQMQHVVNHSTLHRGQVIGMIRQLGVTPPAVDLLYFLLK